MTEPSAEGRLPHDIMGLQPRPFPWIQVVGLSLLLLAIALIAWQLWKRRQIRMAELAKASAMRPVDPWVRIDKDLRSLTVADPWNREACEDFFFRLSLLLREALELRTGLPITRQTLAEAKQSLANFPALSANFQQELVKFLSLADQLKFAGQWISDMESKEWATRVQAWLDQLRTEGHS